MNHGMQDAGMGTQENLANAQFGNGKTEKANLTTDERGSTRIKNGISGKLRARARATKPFMLPDQCDPC
jgi:hypothetical protein